ncbi:ORF_9 [Catopsilia pomona nucleopolyhedrovirus]|uniref:ORF_9 n=1 Tax=Catopsilia pomona nucleopolyhedrovirus TaxID=1850906 RepID=A0A172WZ81_9ABAC|nr:ORF_9 [Catopsilia pomona nucleopolyhedrovirus]ANF29657.1 ORF_9 [Catopsilia pomona nucleopolyhedrovirus]
MESGRYHPYKNINYFHWTNGGDTAIASYTNNSVMQKIATTTNQQQQQPPLLYCKAKKRLDFSLLPPQLPCIMNNINCDNCLARPL